MNTVGLIGYGRFGRLLASILSKEFHVFVYDPALSPDTDPPHESIRFENRETVLTQETCFYAVPIGRFEEILRSDLPLLTAPEGPTLLIDVCSVKLYPQQVMEALLPESTEVLLTHPMFGPDSVANHGLEQQTMVFDQWRCSDERCSLWKEFFERCGIQTLELSADDHDRLAARSQGLAHYIGRVLERMDTSPTPIDTVGAQLLNTIKEQTCNDSWELFTDLQTKNPHTIPMRIALGEAVQSVYAALIPNRVETEYLKVGIQGGKGSFNEEAARYYLERSGVRNFELVYLYTSARVLEALHEGSIDRGQFAIHNSTGGMVQESVEAMAETRFSIVEQYSIKIEHSLMIHPDSSLDSIDTIMTHPQVLKQCKHTLEQKYPRLYKTSGEGDLIDHANVAKHLHEKTLPATTAVMGSKILAELYELTIVETGLQDLEHNYTSFLWVERPAP